MNLLRELVLASQSPRRLELLRGAGLRPRVITPAGVEERHDAALPPEELVLFNARLKSAAVAALHPAALVLGADTLVYLDSDPLGKPESLQEARHMLSRLSGRVHTVCTGVCLSLAEESLQEEFAVRTLVRFRTLTPQQIDDYLQRVHALDKAGGYAAQECGEMIIESMEGSFSNVVGLPMEETLRRLERWRA